MIAAVRRLHCFIQLYALWVSLLALFIVAGVRF